MSSNSESNRSESPEAFNGESTTESSSSDLRREDFKGTDIDSVEATEDLGNYSPTRDMSSDRPSSSG